MEEGWNNKFPRSSWNQRVWKILGASSSGGEELKKPTTIISKREFGINYKVGRKKYCPKWVEKFYDELLQTSFRFLSWDWNANQEILVETTGRAKKNSLEELGVKNWESLCQPKNQGGMGFKYFGKIQWGYVS